MPSKRIPECVPSNITSVVDSKPSTVTEDDGPRSLVQMNFDAAALGMNPVAYAVQNLNLQLNKIDRATGTADRRAERVHDVVKVLNDVQLNLCINQPQGLFTAVLNLELLAQSFVNEFDNIHSQIDSLQQKYEAGSQQFAELLKDLDTYCIYGDWVSKLHVLVAHQLGTTWSQLEECLEMEKDAAAAQPWEEGTWHQKVDGVLKAMSMSHDEWEALLSFSSAWSNRCHDKEWNMLKTRAEKSSKAERDLAALDSIPARYLPVRPLLRKTILAVASNYKWVIAANPGAFSTGESGQQDRPS